MEPLLKEAMGDAAAHATSRAVKRLVEKNMVVKETKIVIGTREKHC